MITLEDKGASFTISNWLLRVRCCTDESEVFLTLFVLCTISFVYDAHSSCTAVLRLNPLFLSLPWFKIFSLIFPIWCKSTSISSCFLAGTYPCGVARSARLISSGSLVRGSNLSKIVENKYVHQVRVELKLCYLEKLISFPEALFEVS
ncbi:hypothetical protein P8452_69333 [Trifolium repens]|nr:hypothetical protein P8452_69333 [Trifolium repens]